MRHIKNIMGILFFIAGNVNAMDQAEFIPVETDHALAKFAGCFVAIKNPEYSKYGYKLTSDTSLLFAVISKNTAPDWYGLGHPSYFLYKFQFPIQAVEGDVSFGIPTEHIWAYKSLRMRLASEEEIKLAIEKIQSKEICLDSDNDGGLQLLRECRNVMTTK